MPPLTDAVIADRLAEIFIRRPATVLARIANSCESAAKKWRRRISLPSVPALIHMMRHDDGVFAAVLELAGRSPSDLTDEERQAVAETIKILEGL
ncbi:hypothetical protein [Telmatospirillum sp.]|uniref:hypothetical protein n=1 Tax=Telmatospirillum sp. TaxID=2079197 RepID=UPI00283C7D3B|nr:hypothetical protein [Telmatospirillum sp.]MDR3439860.1 hypothetical protein [Telmatospirillum sp.]